MISHMNITRPRKAVLYLYMTVVPSCSTRRCHIQEEYSIDLQSGKKPYEEGDHAENPLFNYVRDEALARPTFATFMKLLVRLLLERDYPVGGINSGVRPMI